MRYLQRRGLLGLEKDLPADVMQHLALGYFEGGERVARYPAMVARLRDVSGEMVGLHVTYISDGEKAIGEKSRKMHAVRKGALRGAAIRLYAATERVAITEGIENALAVRLATGWPTWATGSAKLLEFVELPASVRQIAIWADHDTDGRNAAAALERRMTSEGRDVRVQLPPEPGMDSLDWLTDNHVEATQGAAAQGDAA